MFKMIPVIQIFAVITLTSASQYQYRIEPYQMAEGYQTQPETQAHGLQYQQQNYEGYNNKGFQHFQPQSGQEIQYQSGHTFQNPSVQSYQQISAPDYQHEAIQPLGHQQNQNYQHQPENYKPQVFINQPVQDFHQNHQQSQIQSTVSQSGGHVQNSLGNHQSPQPDKSQGFQNQPVQIFHQNHHQNEIQSTVHQTSGHVQNSLGNARILSYQQNSDEHNNYQYVYETENGIRAQESGDGTKTQGEYSYVGDDGQVYTVTYTADETGFHPSGAHLPTPPPVPDAIARSIEKNLRDEANGIVDDGQYHELEQHTQQSDQIHQVADPPLTFHQKMVVKKSVNEQQEIQTSRPRQQDLDLKQEQKLQPQHVTQQPEKQLVVLKREPIIPFRQSHNVLLNILNPEHNLMDHQDIKHDQSTWHHNHRLRQFLPTNELNSHNHLLQQIPQSKTFNSLHQPQVFARRRENQVPLDSDLIEKRSNNKEKYLNSYASHPKRIYHIPLFVKHNHPKNYINPTAVKLVR